MEEKNIILKFIKKGHLLTPEALKFLSKQETNIQEIFNKSYNTLVIDKHHIHTNHISHTQNLHISEPEKTQEIKKHEKDFIILKNLIKKPSEITTSDFVKFYNSKYIKMSKIITTRLNLEFVSINKIDNFKPNYVIGIVRKIINNTKNPVIEIEDQTGRISVVFEPDNKLQELPEKDDVAGFLINKKTDNYLCKKIIYPDVPIRKPTKGIGKACFISGLHLDEAPSSEFEKFLKWFEQQPIKYLFVAGSIGDISKFTKLIEKHCFTKKIFIISEHTENYPDIPYKIDSSLIISLSNPAIIELNNLKILIISHITQDMLKKRYLGKTKTILPDDYLVMDIIPDIIHYSSNKPMTSNYKSITLLTAGSLLSEFKPIILDFETRETEFIKIE